MNPEIYPVIAICLGWLVGLSLVLWWPRSVADNPARARGYRLVARAASCYVLGFLCLGFMILLTDVTGSPLQLLVDLLVLIAISLTPFAIGMLGLDIGFRFLGLAGSALSALFPAGITCFSLLIVIAAFTGGGVPWWLAVALLGSALLCGTSTWLVLEAYAVMRAPRVNAGGNAT